MRHGKQASTCDPLGVRLLCMHYIKTAACCYCQTHMQRITSKFNFSRPYPFSASLFINKHMCGGRKERTNVGHRGKREALRCVSVRERYHSLAYITAFMSNDCWESQYCSVLAGEVFCGTVEAFRAINKTTFRDFYLNNGFYALFLSIRLPLPTLVPFTSFFPSLFIYLFLCYFVVVGQVLRCDNSSQIRGPPSLKPRWNPVVISLLYVVGRTGLLEEMGLFLPNYNRCLLICSFLCSRRDQCIM